MKLYAESYIKHKINTIKGARGPASKHIKPIYTKGNISLYWNIWTLCAASWTNVVHVCRIHAYALFFIEALFILAMQEILTMFFTGTLTRLQKYEKIITKKSGEQ